MICQRCGGLSVATHFEAGHIWEYDGWACLICGNIIDPLILLNRDAQGHGTLRPLSSRGMRAARGSVEPGRYRSLIQS